jgi:hypothetical protein
MDIQKDNKGNSFVEIGSIRLTYVDKSTRQSSKNWSDSDTIRISAYKNDFDNSLHMGAEIPINTNDEILDLIQALCILHKDKSNQNKLTT